MSSRKSRSPAEAKSKAGELAAPSVETVVPPQQPATTVAGPRVTSIVTTASFSGPLPPPALLEAYERTQAGLADRIVRMAESEQSHRQGLERREHDSMITMRLFGLLGAITLALVGMIAGAILLYHDKKIAGFGVFLVAVGTLIGTAIYKHRHPEKPQEEGA